MMNISERTLSVISVALMSVSLAVSALTLDVMWALISAVGLVALAVPKLAKGEWLFYHRSLLVISLIPYLVYLVLFAVNVFTEIEISRYFFLSVQPLASMICAYMLFASLSANSDTTLSKRWIFVFSIAFTCAFAVLYLFVLFFAMKEMGFPLYNPDFEGPGALDNTESNHYIMLPINLAVVFSFVYGILIDKSLKKVDAKDLTRYYGGKEQ